MYTLDDVVRDAEREAVRQMGRHWPGRVEKKHGKHTFKVWAHRKKGPKFRFSFAYQLNGKHASRKQLIEGLAK